MHKMTLTHEDRTNFFVPANTKDKQQNVAGWWTVNSQRRFAKARPANCPQS